MRKESDVACFKFPYQNFPRTTKAKHEKTQYILSSSSVWNQRPPNTNANHPTKTIDDTVIILVM
jgi:hypothetical protein